jgi:hypothetical protein
MRTSTASVLCTISKNDFIYFEYFSCRDIGTSLPELLWQLVEVIPEGCRLRLGKEKSINNSFICFGICVADSRSLV